MEAADRSALARPARALWLWQICADRLYRWRRNVGERCINRIKQWRGLAARDEKWSANYRAMVVIAVIVLWLDA